MARILFNRPGLQKNVLELHHNNVQPTLSRSISHGKQAATVILFDTFPVEIDQKTLARLLRRGRTRAMVWGHMPPLADAHIFVSTLADASALLQKAQIYNVIRNST